MPKGVYPHTHIKPREYPEDIVELVRELYTNQKMTVLEVQAALPKGYKAQRIIERYIPQRRRAVPRNQRGERNACWKGSEAGYEAVHLRLKTEIGAAASHFCHDCGKQAYDWSYQGGAPDERSYPRNGCLYTTDLSYYVPRCRPCHGGYDSKKRAPNSYSETETP